MGIVDDDYVGEPRPIVNENLKGKTIVDFDLGGNTLLILTGIYSFLYVFCEFLENR